MKRIHWCDAPTRKLREFEVCQVSNRREAAAPSKSQPGLGPLAYLIPEPLRNGVTANAQKIQIKSAPKKMIAAKRSRETFVDQRRLLTRRTAAAKVDNAGRIPLIPERVDEYSGAPRHFGIERIDLLLGRIVGHYWAVTFARGILIPCM